MGAAISVSELKRLSPGDIRALDQPISVTDGAETVAVLSPIRNHPVLSPERAAEVERAWRKFEATVAKRTREEQAMLSQWLKDRGIED